MNTAPLDVRLVKTVEALDGDQKKAWIRARGFWDTLAQDPQGAATLTSRAAYAPALVRVAAHARVSGWPYWFNLSLEHALFLALDDPNTARQLWDGPEGGSVLEDWVCICPRARQALERLGERQAGRMSTLAKWMDTWLPGGVWEHSGLEAWVGRVITGDKNLGSFPLEDPDLFPGVSFPDDKDTLAKLARCVRNKVNGSSSGPGIVYWKLPTHALDQADRLVAGLRWSASTLMHMRRLDRYDQGTLLGYHPSRLGAILGAKTPLRNELSFRPSLLMEMLGAEGGPQQLTVVLGDPRMGASVERMTLENLATLAQQRMWLDWRAPDGNHLMGVWLQQCKGKQQESVPAWLLERLVRRASEWMFESSGDQPPSIFLLGITPQEQALAHRTHLAQQVRGPKRLASQPTRRF